MKHAKPHGFTMIELAVTMSIAALLLALAAPSLTSAASTAKARVVVNRMTQDYQWARGRAAMGRTASVTFTLNADCSWVTSAGGVVDTAHSYTTTQVAAGAAGLTCTSQAGGALPIVFVFDSQGMVAPSAQLSFTSDKGQVWPLRLLNSGSIVLTTGTS